MARKTKLEALATRSRILDAAEQVFHARGVSGTSLQDIAAAAGMTRGAIYWHFQDKGDLFNAMMARVCLPMEEAKAMIGAGPAATLLPVLPLLRAQLLDVLARVVGDAQVRRVFEIATLKVEYLDELSAVRDRHRQIRGDYLALIERLLRQGQQRGEVVRRPSARTLAIGLHALLDGLIQNWMLEPEGFDLRRVGREVVDRHLLGLASQAAVAPTAA